MLELWTIFLRTILVYFTVFFMLRIMGKREIGKLSIFDLVISIMIAEIAVFVLEDTKKPLIEGLLPMVTMVGIQLVIAYAILKSLTLRKLFDGSPSYIIEHGKLNRREMSRHRYNLSDLMLQLRQSNITNVADVEFAILETTGKLTIVKKDDYRREDRRLSPLGMMEASTELGDQELMTNIRFEGLPLPLIMDGKVLDENLKKIGHDRFWLKNQIQLKGAKEFKEVFFCTIDHRGKLFIDLI
jgi:uncharacterized membrane protein YcaP (DUF421 family)